MDQSEIDERSVAAVSEALRQLPSIDRLLQLEGTNDLVLQYGRELAVEALRTTLDSLRAEIRSGRSSLPADPIVVAKAGEWLAALLQPTLRPVVNATGVIIHTNLGRAPLAARALTAVNEISPGYSTLEYDLAAGQRGSRAVHAEQLLKRLTGTQAALVVNNNAAAVLLMLTALCQGREVIISRGQLVEIGGGFRVPDVMAQSGARLVEVGTTNRTHLHDYQLAINENTAAILVAHHSNFKMVGFTSEPGLDELARLAHDHGLPLFYDQGSGAFLDTAQYGLAHEPTVQEGLAAGVDLIAFSGDKLLGGPQAGILCGRDELVGTLKRHPLARAVRPDKLCLAALAATLELYLTEEAVGAVPIWQMIGRPLAELQEQAGALAAYLQSLGVNADVIAGYSTVGGGSLPGTELPTWLVAIDRPGVDSLAAELRTHVPPVIIRIADDRLLVDLRTVLPEQMAILQQALTNIFA
jgi:L-seryl-tRNA(Ser) seleniumtransferase